MIYKSKKIGALFLNGAKIKKAVLKQTYKNINFCVFCDGAYDKYIDIIKPNVIIGDMDSIRKKIDISEKIQKITYPKEKDETDGELGLKHLLIQGVEEILIFGALGGRADYNFGNYYLLNCCGDVPCKIISNDFEITLIKGLFKIKKNKKKLISLIPFDELVHILYTKGLKYPINNKILTRKELIGMSNEIINDDIEISIKSGRLLFFMNI